jgi:PAS domain S-box-containing protein
MPASPPMRPDTGKVASPNITKYIAVLTVHRENAMISRQFDPEQFMLVAGDAIIAADADGSIVLWNPAAERIFGYTESEALGRSLDLIIPERLHHRHWAGYRQVMKTGQTRYGTEVLHVPAVHKDGRTLSIAFTVALMDTPDKQSRIITAILRDETLRWKEERALRQRLAELEARND